MNVNIPNYAKNVKKSYINTNCPNMTCYNKAYCNYIKKRCGTSNKCSDKKFCQRADVRLKRMQCNAIRGKCGSWTNWGAYNCSNNQQKRFCARYNAQKKIGLLSNDRNSQNVRQGKSSNLYCIEKPVYSNSADQRFYNKIYNRVHTSFVRRFYPDPSKLTKIQLKKLKAYAKQYTLQWLKSYASSQGPTVDGWPATSLVGDNNQHFSEVHDGYATNCCISKTNLKLIKKAIRDSGSFCKIQKGPCSSLYCRKMIELRRKQLRG